MNACPTGKRVSLDNSNGVDMHTWSPSSRQDFTRNRVAQGHGGESNSDQNLGGDEPVNGLGARCNGSSDHGNGERTDEQGLADLKDVRGGRQQRAKDGLNEVEGVGNPSLGRGILESYADCGELFPIVSVFGQDIGFLCDLLPREARRWKTY